MMIPSLIALSSGFGVGLDYGLKPPLGYDKMLVEGFHAGKCVSLA